ncbi:MAG: crossover junction endodeoxyribonuclease RuvC [Gammaproteobacteria bacterium]|nr:crossover junction endodeoxyribonuclease RuvC [Gammaproteobacteria bacterium]
MLGIDPGSRITGYGIIDIHQGRSSYLSSGAIHTSGASLPERLKEIFDAVTTLINQYNPNEVAIERVFMHRNPDSALKLGQARGAAICAVMAGDLSVHEYTPAEIKKAVVGKGNAEKGQIQHMICALLQLNATPQADAADALAVALCHHHTRTLLDKIPAVSSSRAGRYR